MLNYFAIERFHKNQNDRVPQQVDCGYQKLPSVFLFVIAWVVPELQSGELQIQQNLKYKIKPAKLTTKM